jgi:uncharacterized membrane protein YfcA
MPTNIGALVLLCALGALTLWYIARWYPLERSRVRDSSAEQIRPGLIDGLIGLVTNFLDTLGIGSFAPTTAIFKLRHRPPDEQIPGTLNAGRALPTITQALIFITAVTVDLTTLVGLIAAAVLGARAFLMPIGGARFIQTGRYNLRSALDLALGGIPGVLAAAFIVKSLPIEWLRWLVTLVVLYAAVPMLLSARPQVDASQPPPKAR